MDSQLISSSLAALTHKYREITHNLANASTVAYKRRYNEFSLSSSGSDQDTGTGDTLQVDTSVDLAQGHMVSTGRPLDFAINGPGFFVVETDAGRIYTRNGQFRLNADGTLVDFAGRTVASEQGGPITMPPNVPPTALHISGDGTLRHKKTPIGKLAIVQVDRPSDLVPIGDSGFRQAGAVAPRKAEKGFEVEQGFNEASNVSVVKELVDLITVSRMYEANMRSVRIDDERKKTILDVATS